MKASHKFYSDKKLVSIASSLFWTNKFFFKALHGVLKFLISSAMQNCNTKAVSKLTRRTKGKKKKDVGINNVHVAETRSEFLFSIAKIAVAQICQSLGFKTSKHNAIETLTNVSIRYLEALASSAATFANASNRTDSNLFDVINGIHDLCSVQGFLGASMMHESDLLRSPALEEIMNFVNLSKEVPFAKPIPTNKNPKLSIDSGLSLHCETQGLHIPKWLPDFPKENFYRKVPIKERKYGEKLWEDSLVREDCSGILQSNDINGKEEKDEPKMAKMELVKGRERVKFIMRKTELVKGRERVKFIMRKTEEKQLASGLRLNTMAEVCKGRKRVYWNKEKIKDVIIEKDDNERR